MNRNKKLITVVETLEFIKQAKLCMTEHSKKEFIDFIASSPLAGEVIVGTGGIRKVRWASANNKGKSGGSRVIYFYHNDDMPLFLFTVYGKAMKENLSQQERNQLKLIVKALIDSYRSDNHD